MEQEQFIERVDDDTDDNYVGEDGNEFANQSD